MDRRVSFVVGGVLIATGVLAILLTLVVPVLLVNAWRLWPLIVVGVGLCFLVPPFLVRRRRGLGGLFIPGVPILSTGGILLFASVFDWWNAWEWLWPLEVLSVAVGFLLAAIHMRAIWLAIPATIIGLNGLVLQFCAVTGLWETWAVLWVVEPFSVGASLLFIGVVKRAGGLLLAGAILCGVAGAGLAVMMVVLSATVFPQSIALSWVGQLFRLLGPGILIVVGLLLLVWGVMGRRFGRAVFKKGE